MSVLDLYRRATESFAARLKLVTDDQWELPTPCTEWNVRALVNHIVYEDRWAIPLMEGKTVAEAGDELDGDLLGDDPMGAYEDAVAQALAICEEPGAMERTVHVSFGDISAEMYMGQLFTDHLIHGWDLARAIGADESLDPELVEVCYAESKPLEDMLKGTGLFGERIEPPEDADMQTKLLAIYGREA